MTTRKNAKTETPTETPTAPTFAPPATIESDKGRVSFDMAKLPDGWTVNPGKTLAASEDAYAWIGNDGNAYGCEVSVYETSADTRKARNLQLAYGAKQKADDSGAKGSNKSKVAEAATAIVAGLLSVWEAKASGETPTVDPDAAFRIAAINGWLGVKLALPAFKASWTKHKGKGNPRTFEDLRTRLARLATEKADAKGEDLPDVRWKVIEEDLNARIAEAKKLADAMPETEGDGLGF